MRKKTHEEFIKELSIKNPDIEVLEQYKNTDTKIIVRCKTCSHIWSVRPSDLLRDNKTGCPKCMLKQSGAKRTKSHEQFEKELYEINPNVEILSSYVNNRTKINVKCKICNHIWSATPNSLVGKNATGCPSCNISKGERAIKTYLELQNIDFETQKTFEGLLGVGGGLLSYDFYLSDYNLLIEYQGAFHDGSVKTCFQTTCELKKQQEHDKRKRNYAKEHNIALLEIWYWDFDNIKQILNTKLNFNNKKKSA